MSWSKWLCLVLVGAFGTSDFFAPLPALAQAPTPTPEVTTAPPPPPPPLPPPPGPSTNEKVAAGFLNVVYVPGKAILCGAGTIASAGLMLLTFGNAYQPAARVFNEGCGGHWLLTPYDVSGKRPPEERASD